MNERTVAIINELCKNRKTVTIGELAEQFDVSQRTIRNDLNTINGFLVENGYDTLKLKRGGAIIKESDFSDILMFVSEGDYYLEFEQFPYLILWSSTNNGPFIALEPWTGLSTCSDEGDVFEKKEICKV